MLPTMSLDSCQTGCGREILDLYNLSTVGTIKTWYDEKNAMLFERSRVRGLDHVVSSTADVLGGLPKL